MSKNLSGVRTVPDNVTVFHLIVHYLDGVKWKRANVPYHVAALTKSSAKLKALNFLKMNYDTIGVKLTVDIKDVTGENNQIII